MRYQIAPPSQTVKAPQLEPLNCRAILNARTFKSRRLDGQIRLLFQIDKNPNFNEALGDACEGNMRNLWQDFRRFTPLIEEHSQNLSHISGVFGYNLDHFPVTKADVKSFIDEAATETRLEAKLLSYDRSTVEGGMKIQGVSRKFLMQNLQTYLELEHKPIIEGLLGNNIHMDEYSGEKIQYCYNSFNSCEYLAPNKPIANGFNFDFIGVGIDVWTFEHDKQDNLK